jgi:hypothetical protein
MFEAILAALVDQRIRAVVVGGVAAAVHGSARLTNDIDLCYDTATDNVERIARLMASWHASLRGAPAGLPFFMDVRTFRTTPLLTLTTDMGDIDLLDLVPGVGDYAAAHASSMTFEIGTTRFQALTLDALIAAKRATRRKKDLEHLIELEALRALRGRNG